HWIVAPPATSWLVAWTPSTVTTIVSGSSEQFFAEPETVMSAPVHAFTGPLAVSWTHGTSLHATVTVLLSAPTGRQVPVPLAVTWTHGLSSQRTLTVGASAFASPHSLVALACTANGTDLPATHSPMLPANVYGTVAPAATVALNAWAPLTVTTTVSSSFEQFVMLPEIVTAVFGHASGGPEAVTWTHG